MVAVDASGAKVYAVVGVEEHVLKSVIVGLAGWARHFREIPSRRKTGYLRRFPDRYKRLLPHLAVSRICLTLDCITRILQGLDVEKAVVDDKLLQRLSLGIEAIPESIAVRSRHYRILVTLADNLANYARILLERNPDRALQAVKALEK